MILACASLFGGTVERILGGGLLGLGIFLAALFVKFCRRRMGKWIGTLVAAVVIVVPTAAVSPALYSTHVKFLMTRSNCQVKQIGLALAQYSLEHDNVLPSTLDVLVPRLIQPSVLVDALTDKRFIYAGAGLKWNADWTSVVLYSPPTPRGANVLYLDGHVAWISRGALEDALKKQKQQSAAGV